MVFLIDCRLALVLADALSGDRLFSFFFQGGTLGSITRAFFFFDEIRFRRKHGLVLTEGFSVALVGLPPKLYIAAIDLSWVTKFLIALQGDEYSNRFKFAFAERSSETIIERDLIYLSAIATPARERRAGKGSRLLLRIEEVANARGVGIECEVSSAELVAWYQARHFQLKTTLDFVPGVQVSVLNYCQ
jgi:hypothetical protein